MALAELTAGGEWNKFCMQCDSLIRWEGQNFQLKEVQRLEVEDLHYGTSATELYVCRYRCK